MGTHGSFAYRYNGRYYRQLYWHDAYPSGHGQWLIDAIPRDPSAFKDWVADRIKMLENARTGYEEVYHPSDGGDADGLNFQLVHNADWTFSKWTYVIDLDNLRYVVNGTINFNLDNLPLYLDDFPFDDLEHNDDHRGDCWPPPNFNTEESQKNYDTLQPIVVPANEWGAPTWDQLSVCQQFSIQITDHLLRETAGKFDYAYAPSVRSHIDAFCWNMLCASAPALPLFQWDDIDSENMCLSRQTLSPGSPPGFDIRRTRMPHAGMSFLLDNKPPDYTEGKPIEYFWVRGCLITFCLRLVEPTYVTHEVEKMVRKMRLDGSSESVGVILSSQQELVVVAVDGLQVRHSPVLTIRAVGERPGRPSEGRLILTYLLSPTCTTTPLPWRITQPYQSSSTSPTSIADLPSEVLRIIVHQVDIGTYLALCCVSRSIRSICVANPRVRCYTMLHKIPGFETFFAARSAIDGTLKTIALRYCRYPERYSKSFWQFRDVSSEEFEKLKLKDSYIYTQGSLFRRRGWERL
ncbi:unnamed protein product [Rhizoctonia solani]|uniref:F-box domain-containing protein n=1 Tax=Rhizoctonia solani TaxID=456999 RepID=A0A8H3C0R3_9AGAM|nr:unnamed protein product [Rhizoctonia solani]